MFRNIRKAPTGSLYPILLVTLWLAATAEAEPDPSEGFSRLLREHVDDGLVNYRGFLHDETFANYLDYIGQKQLSPSLPPAAQLAFYINAYNALAIKGILDGSSPRTFFARVKYFRRDKYLVAGKKMNLYDLEHKIIRPFKEPRIHFALVCASTACPKLRSETYSADELERQLAENTLDFINDASKNDFDLAAGNANLSKIFSWFKEDFTAQMSLQNYIAQFVGNDKVKAALEADSLKIKYKKYDWSLNGKL